ncbi:kinase-like domain-containing protein [Pilobolus umbonatus]|nr:kinase-like domain-containing protein [Pilobolus umbonatus]
MERIDSIHSSTSLEDRLPKPILVSYNSNARKSITGTDLLNGLKIPTNTDNVPSSPIPSQNDHSIHFDDFELKEHIGYGSSAIVYKAIYKAMNKKVALKMIDLDMFERNQIDELRRETALMALSKHPNVLRVYGSFVHGSKLYIVTPYLAGGSCLDIMKTRFPDGLDELSIATILKQALEALCYLHKNGHIHRDVKAGNLLMDDDGTVLLGDFGVSSSLIETGERGMRKTFVGTPCWMAPEVMEQAEYDYKADIWSFGITALELATGHAPFAKYPPLKVLKMTLSNDPPTLEREAGTHKFTKSFKDMIDICLVKDPSKRPTADKLLQHPFFKQAKRKDYLIKSILSELPPLEQRPRKKIPFKQVSITKTAAWDFDDDEDTEEDHSDQDQRKTTPVQPKRHISFGDVIVRSNSNLPTESVVSPHMTVGTPPRKSRFVIEETPRENNDCISSVRSASPMAEDVNDHHDGEVMKGRFYVNQPKRVTSNEALNMNYDEQHPISSIPINNKEGCVDRKSRFEIQHNSTSSAASSPMIYQPIPLSRDSSYSSVGTSLTREGSSHRPRYPLEPFPKDLLSNENMALLTESSRKIGRFELTGGEIVSSRNNSISALTNASTEQLHPYEQVVPQFQLDELIRNNETQRILLQELSNALNKKPEFGQRRESDASNVVTSKHGSPITDDLSATIEHLERLVQLTLRENSQLQKENDSLRRELKEMKK